MEPLGTAAEQSVLYTKPLAGWGWNMALVLAKLFTLVQDLVFQKKAPMDHQTGTVGLLLSRGNVFLLSAEAKNRAMTLPENLLIILSGTLFSYNKALELIYFV